MSSYISILSEFAQNPRVAHAEGVLVHPTHRVCVIAAPVRPIGLCIDYMYNAQLNNCYSSVCMHEKTVCAAAWLFCLHQLGLLSSPACRLFIYFFSLAGWPVFAELADLSSQIRTGSTSSLAGVVITVYLEITGPADLCSSSELVLYLHRLALISSLAAHLCSPAGSAYWTRYVDTAQGHMNSFACTPVILTVRVPLTRLLWLIW